MATGTEDRLVPIVFTGGLNTTATPELLQPVELTVADNVEWTRGNAISKRRGWRSTTMNDLGDATFTGPICMCETPNGLLVYQTENKGNYGYVTSMVAVDETTGGVTTLGALDYSTNEVPFLGYNGATVNETSVPQPCLSDEINVGGGTLYGGDSCVVGAKRFIAASVGLETAGMTVSIQVRDAVTHALICATWITTPAGTQPHLRLVPDVDGLSAILLVQISGMTDIIVQPFRVSHMTAVATLHPFLAQFHVGPRADLLQGTGLWDIHRSEGANPSVAIVRVDPATPLTVRLKTYVYPSYTGAEIAAMTSAAGYTSVTCYMGSSTLGVAVVAMNAGASKNVLIARCSYTPAVVNPTITVATPSSGQQVSVTYTRRDPLSGNGEWTLYYDNGPGLSGKSYTDSLTATAWTWPYMQANRLAAKISVDADGSLLVPTSLTSDLQPQYVLYNVTSGKRVVARWDYGGAFKGTSPDFGLLPNFNGGFVSLHTDNSVFTPAPYTSRFYSADLRRTLVPSDAAGVRPTPYLQAHGMCSQGISYIATGSVLLESNGVDVFENGFFTFPEHYASNSPNTTAIGAGTYGFRCVFMHQDSLGRMHRSAPSVPASVVTAAGDQTSVGLKGAIVTMRGMDERTTGGLKLEIYRTVAGGSTYYLDSVHSVPRASAFAVPGGSVLFVTSGQSDTAISDNQLLYTEGGILENIAPTHVRCVTAHGGRIFCGSGASSVWYSKLQTFPNEPVAFNDALSVPIDTASEVTALVSDKGRLCIFTGVEIFQLNGDGPDNAGLQNDFARAQSLSNSHGCIRPRTVVPTSDGVYFVSAFGVSLLKGYEIENVGLPIRGPGWAVSNIVAADQMPSKSQIRFICDDTLGYAYVLDTLGKRWSRFLPYGGCDALCIQGIFYFVSRGSAATKQCYLKMAKEQELTTSFGAMWQDDGASVNVTLQTASIALAGLDGYQRLKRVFMRMSLQGPYEFTLDLRTDVDEFNGAAPSSSFTFSSYSLASQDNAEVSAHVKVQKCRNVVLKLTETSDFGGAAGFILNGISLLIGAKRGYSKAVGSGRMTPQ